MDKKSEEVFKEAFREVWNEAYPEGSVIPDDPEQIAFMFFGKGWDNALGFAVAATESVFSTAQDDVTHMGGIGNSKLNVHRMWGDGNPDPTYAGK